MPEENIYHIDTASLILNALEKSLDTAIISACHGTQWKVEIVLDPVVSYSDAFLQKIREVLEKRKILSSVEVGKDEEIWMKVSFGISIPENHADCKTQWEKALWWRKNWERWASSLTIWNTLLGGTKSQISTPADIWDFGRCYQLLEYIPEWKNELHKLAALSPRWSILVAHWKDLSIAYKNCKKFPENPQYQQIFYLTLGK